jgi:hypothetical protein
MRLYRVLAADGSGERAWMGVPSGGGAGAGEQTARRDAPIAPRLHRVHRTITISGEFWALLRPVRAHGACLLRPEAKVRA